MIPILSKHQAPSAIKVIKATGISSGKILIANVRAFNKLSNKLFDEIKLIDQTIKKQLTQ